MKYWLIIQMFAFGIPTFVLGEPYDTLEQCEVRLYERIEEWKLTYESSPDMGVEAICREQ